MPSRPNSRTSPSSGRGQSAKITVQAYPGRVFEGRVAFIYPTVNAQTRTAKVRIEVPNPELLLKTDMYATVEISAPATSATIAAARRRIRRRPPP